MGRDLMEEQTLIDLSRVQREALERWVPILLNAGEVAVAEEVRHTAARAEVAFLKSLLPMENA